MSRAALFTAKGVAVVLAAAVLVGVGIGWGTKAWYDSKFEHVESLDENSKDIQRPQAQTGTENFLLVGSDSRAGDNAPEGSKVAGARSDTVMIAHIPADRSRVVVVSFPRDLEVDRPECPSWNAAKRTYSGDTATGARQAKLNTAYAFGGPRCVTKIVQKLTGLRINHFVGLEFSGFKQMVDAVGGVPMNISDPVIDKMRGTIVAEPGRVTFDGDRALKFVRARYVQGDPTSDYGRMKRQQQFIAALLGKTMSRDVLLDTGKMNDFVTAFTDTTFGDRLGVDELLTLAQSMQATGADRIHFRTVPTTGGANERGNEVLVEREATRLFDALIDNKPLPSGR